MRTNHVILPDRSPFEVVEETMPPRVPDDPGYPPLTTKQQFQPPAHLLGEP